MDLQEILSSVLGGDDALKGSAYVLELKWDSLTAEERWPVFREAFDSTSPADAAFKNVEAEREAMFRITFDRTSLWKRAWGYVFSTTAASDIADITFRYVLDTSDQRLCLSKQVVDCVKSHQYDLQKVITAMEDDGSVSVSKVLQQVAEAYICTPPQFNRLASVTLTDSPVGGSPIQDRYAMPEWLLSGLDFDERQTWLLLRFLDAHSVAEKLNRTKDRVDMLDRVDILFRQAQKKLEEHKEKTIWKDWKPKVFGDGETCEIKEAYAKVWGPSVNKLAYIILADQKGAGVVVNRVGMLAEMFFKQGKSNWREFKTMTFEVCKEYLIQYSERERRYVQPKRDDKWAKLVSELPVLEYKCVLLSIFYTARSAEIIHKLLSKTVSQACIEECMTSGFQKIIKRSLI